MGIERFLQQKKQQIKVCFLDARGERLDMVGDTLHNILHRHAKDFSDYQIWRQDPEDRYLFHEYKERSTTNDGGTYLMKSGAMIWIKKNGEKK